MDCALSLCGLNTTTQEKIVVHTGIFGKGAPSEIH